MTSLFVANTTEELRQQVDTWRRQGLRIGFVPTMGYLHQGHLSLVRLAHQHADRVVASIYVNPTQFEPHEDLDRYPRDPEGDQTKLATEGVHLLFHPDNATMYPPGAQTFVEVKEIARPLCGVDRPHHFRGVATVVTKLFHLVQPDVAVFGQKDYQQLLLIRQMVRDLCMAVEILGAPIVREADGLAMSSRNAYLDPAQRQAATSLSRALREARRLYRQGERDAPPLQQAAAAVIAQEPLASPQYIELRRDPTLDEVSGQTQPSDRLFLAVRVGQTRLIDNAPLAGDCGLGD